ncbi:hypothetical protein B0H13DRAFT_1889029 [Mycena leptocephala]|nr:hypothetical protein B0H13DRAFT_1889029 [Mycena leptocephala]
MVEEMLPKDPLLENAPLVVDSAIDNDEDEIPELVDEDDLDFLESNRKSEAIPKLARRDGSLQMGVKSTTIAGFSFPFSIAYEGSFRIRNCKAHPQCNHTDLQRGERFNWDHMYFKLAAVTDGETPEHL